MLGSQHRFLLLNDTLPSAYKIPKTSYLYVLPKSCHNLYKKPVFLLCTFSQHLQTNNNFIASFMKQQKCTFLCFQYNFVLPLSGHFTNQTQCIFPCFPGTINIWIMRKYDSLPPFLTIDPLSSKHFRINVQFGDFILNDSLCCSQNSSGLGLISAALFQSINNQGFFLCFNN